MRITLNLASKPFIELRPLYSRLRWWAVILLITALPLWLLLKTQQEKAAASNARLDHINTEIQRLRNQQQSYQAMMRQPQNAAVLTQAAFLNQLFARKSFSWTAIMMDLETVLPGGVQVLNIDPVTDKSGNVTIRLRVSGQRDRAVELVRNLEHSRHFLEPQLASESAETSNTGNGSQPNLQTASETGNVNFDILAAYNPLQVPALAKGVKAASALSATGTASRRKSSSTPATSSKAAVPKSKRPSPAKPAAAPQSEMSRP